MQVRAQIVLIKHNKLSKLKMQWIKVRPIKDVLKLHLFSEKLINNLQDTKAKINNNLVPTKSTILLTDNGRWTIGRKIDSFNNKTKITKTSFKTKFLNLRILGGN